MSNIESALDEIRPGLAADSFDLQLRDVASDGTVTVVLEALPGACHDCLVPDAMMVTILENAIREQMPDLKGVILEKAGFDQAQPKM